ncbi:MAG: dihydroorotate dehydrogenase-like protein [Sphaerochaetaceae bacterium]|jgi:dihydroorotate dehydrogenase (fumarate)
MSRLKTTYCNLELKNPIIVGSSPLTSSLDRLKKCEDSGAGAVVVKSIFEEQIDFDSAQMMKESEGFIAHTDGVDFLSEISKNHYIDAYLETIDQASSSLEIPVIASINCKHMGSWIDYVDRFSESGADALELNYYILPSDFSRTASDIEEEYMSVVQEVKNRTTIPLSIKMGSHFTALAHVIKQFDEMGVEALVLFNRFYQPDIDIKKLTTKSSVVLSNPADYAEAMQWTALLSAYLNADICASTGIHSGDTLIKMLLAGAKAVQIVSPIMKGGHKVIEQMNNELLTWMDSHEFNDFVDFRGKLAHKRMDDPTQWERAQYMKSLNVEF